MVARLEKVQYGRDGRHARARRAAFDSAFQRSNVFFEACSCRIAASRVVIPFGRVEVVPRKRRTRVNRSDHAVVGRVLIHTGMNTPSLKGKLFVVAGIHAASRAFGEDDLVIRRDGPQKLLARGDGLGLSSRIDSLRSPTRGHNKRQFAEQRRTDSPPGQSIQCFRFARLRSWSGRTRFVDIASSPGSSLAPLNRVWARTAKIDITRPTFTVSVVCCAN